jgi:hypothetical protein
MQWYVSQNGKASGPFEEERLATLVRWGKISRDAFICDEQYSTWIAIRRSAFAPLFPPPAAREETRADCGVRVPSPRSGNVDESTNKRLGWFTLSVLLAGVFMASWL